MDEKQLAKREKMIARIQEFTLMDDDFMTCFFDGDIECTEFLLKTILGKDLTVTEVTAQKVIKSLKSRSVRLDVFARDSEQKPYDIEIQRADEGAGAKRARYNSAMMDTDETVTGMNTDELPESYVIFITENDIYGKNKPLYHIERKIVELDNKDFEDGTHIIYVNGKYRADDAIGSLMHDFSCKKADDMKSKLLAEKTRELKENTTGVQKMCKIMEEFVEEARMEGRMEGRAEARTETRNEVAEDLLKDGSLSIERISAISRLPTERVKELAEKIAAK